MAYRLTTTLALLAALPLMGTPSATLAAPDATCMATFYQTKDMACINTILDKLRDSADSWANSPRSVPYAPTGFLAEVFRDYPKEREHLLHQNVPDPFKSLYLTALLYAGLSDDAKQYAQHMGWSGGDEKLRRGVLPTLEQVRPRSNPADNDLLIGAYKASGNTDYITAILDNYATADDGMASDALRIGLVSGQFGLRLTAPGRPDAMATAACTKYHCKSDAKDFLRLMTLATAFWSLHSLAQHDDGIRSSLDSFFDQHRHLRELLAAERTAFASYITLLSASAGITDNDAISSSLSTYEHFGSPKDAFPTMKRIRIHQP